jgi:hypothetical protein
MQNPMDGTPSPRNNEDTIDLAAFKRISPQSVAERKILINLQVRNPKANEFIRVNPDLTLRYETMLAEDRGKGRGAAYLVKQDLQVVLYRYLSPKILVPTVNSVGDEFVWAVNDRRDHRGDLTDWAATAQSAVLIAQTRWIKVLSDMPNGQYEAKEPVDVEAFQEDEPVFTLTDLPTIISLAFKNHTITSLDHPWAKEMLGKR